VVCGGEQPARPSHDHVPLTTGSPMIPPKFQRALTDEAWQSATAIIRLLMLPWPGAAGVSLSGTGRREP
jgi:hypothetical protein